VAGTFTKGKVQGNALEPTTFSKEPRIMDVVFVFGI
jgi:hypothetical protein